VPKIKSFPPSGEGVATISRSFGSSASPLRHVEKSSHGFGYGGGRARALFCSQPASPAPVEKNPGGGFGLTAGPKRMVSGSETILSEAQH